MALRTDQRRSDALLGDEFRRYLWVQYVVVDYEGYLVY